MLPITLGIRKRGHYISLLEIYIRKEISTLQRMCYMWYVRGVGSLLTVARRLRVGECTVRGVRWLLGVGRHWGKRLSSVVVYLDRPVEIRGHSVWFGGALHPVERYIFRRWCHVGGMWFVPGCVVLLPLRCVFLLSCFFLCVGSGISAPLFMYLVWWRGDPLSRGV